MNKPLNVFEKLGDGAFALDIDQTIILWNEMAENMLGYSAAEALGKKCWELLKGTRLDGEPYCRENCPVIEQIRTGQPVHHVDLVVNGRSAQKYAINVSTLPVQGEAQGLEAVSLVHLYRPLKTIPTSPLELRIYILGTYDVIRPDGLLLAGRKWRQSPARSLLGCLIIHRGQPVSAAALHNCLWPDLAPAEAYQQLDTAVLQLVKFLEPGLNTAQASQYITCDQGSYHLKLDCVWLDVLVFEEQVQKGLSSYEPAIALDHFERALALYQGDMLADFESCSFWFQTEKTRLLKAYETALNHAYKLYQEKQEHLKAEECANKLGELGQPSSFIRQPHR